jgi:hypothetical protein
MLKLFKKAPKDSAGSWRRRLTAEGVVLSKHDADEESSALTEATLEGLLAQLSDDGLAVDTEDGVLLGWDAIYAALTRYPGLDTLLALPPETAARIALRSSGSLSDTDFEISVSGWDAGQLGHAADWNLQGALLTRDGTIERIQPAQWELYREVVGFSRRPSSERRDLANRQAWGRIRKLALTADARLDDFLFRSVVLSPEKLEIGLRRSDAVADDRVVEIEPGFAGAPPGWMDAFDRERQVRDRYDLATGDGIVQVLISAKVRTVLQEVKRLPGRRVAGTRAEAFLLNPYATLGDDAVDVIVEGQFEAAREAAGLNYERFTPQFERDASGYPLKVGLLIETANTFGPLSSECQWLDDEQLGTFVRLLEAAVKRGHQLLAWEGYDLELQGEAHRQLEELKQALERRLAPPPLVSYAQVHDLSGYSSRIESIGVEKPYYSLYIAKKDEGESWFPENVVPVVVYQPPGASEPISVPTDGKAMESLQKAIAEARSSGDDTISVPWLPKPLPVAEAEEITQVFEKVIDDIVHRGTVESPTRPPQTRGSTLAPKKQLVLRANIQSVEYEEQRRGALEDVPPEPVVPRSIRPNLSLLPHQRAGLAWMQHLYGLRNEFQVRGAVLADDMGLGKTFQLLSLMAWMLEKDGDVDPMLVVAPVSLLENWAAEAGKFFVDGALPVLTAYGDGISALRVPRAQIDQRLQTEDGLVKFLKPGWVGSSKLVLTTYETLRDLEFSFAAQKWSVMVCDEAQRIKNPAAMVTRAAKKQNAGFRIACTGTPVENTLADLWCLFDYVQPGLLGALNDFGQRYRKPIEAKTEEEKARVEELRTRIAPQILRRMKADVAKDLPPKVVDSACRRLSLSDTQRNLYASAIESFKHRNDPSRPTPFKNHLGLLHYLRLVCTDPRQHGLSVFRAEATSDYRRKAPKLDWLLKTLSTIKGQREKAIVFCEFREIQRLLKHYIELELGCKADIINGDVSASSSSTASRQKRISAFQAADGFGVLILSPVAVGFGVNIQAANHVIHYTRTWNPAKEDQATDRAYRIGQKKPVYVYYPVVAAEDFVTFDVKLDQLLSYKRSLADDMLNGSGDLGPGEFNITDIVPPGGRPNLDQRVTLEMAHELHWQLFECLVTALWSKQGYVCYRTPGSGDHGVDVIAIKGSNGVLVQTKTSGTPNHALGWDAVKEVVAGEAFYRRRHPDIEFSKVCVTNQNFNSQARDHAALNSVALVEQEHLASLLRDHNVTLLEVERMLHTEWSQPDEAMEEAV